MIGAFIKIQLLNKADIYVIYIHVFAKNSFGVGGGGALQTVSCIQCTLIHMVQPLTRSHTHCLCTTNEQKQIMHVQYMEDICSERLWYK